MTDADNGSRVLPNESVNGAKDARMPAAGVDTMERADVGSGYDDAGGSRGMLYNQNRKPQKQQQHEGSKDPVAALMAVKALIRFFAFDPEYGKELPEGAITFPAVELGHFYEKNPAHKIVIKKWN
eukprot:gene31336-14910_t